MAKLYWRVKKLGKWTWTAAHVYSSNALTTIAHNYKSLQEEE